MYRLRRNLFGYRQEDVNQYIQSYERECQIVIKSKYNELDEIKESNQDKKAQIKAARKKIENLNRKKEEIFHSFVEQLTAIEDALKQSKQEANDKRQLALNKLQLKIADVENWSGRLKNCYTDIIAVQDKYQSLILDK